MLVLQVFNVKCIVIYTNYITILNTETKHHTTKHNYQHNSMYIHLVSSCRIFCTSSSSLTIHSTAKLSNAKPEPKKVKHKEIRLCVNLTQNISYSRHAQKWPRVNETREAFLIGSMVSLKSKYK